MWRGRLLPGRGAVLPPSGRLGGAVWDRCVWRFAALAALVGVVFWGAEGVSGEGADSWSSVDDGLALVRERYLPAVIWYPGAGAVERPDAFDELLESSDLRRVLRRFVRVRVEERDLVKPYPFLALWEAKGPPREKGPDGGGKVQRKGGEDKEKEGGEEPGKAGPVGADPPPPEEALQKPSADTVGDVLRLPPAPQALLVIDYREIVRRRYDGVLPRRSRLQKELSRIAKVNEIYARYARRAEKQIAASERAHGQGDPRKAVLVVRGLEEPTELKRLDPVLTEKVTALLQKYRDEAKKLLRKADALEKDADSLARNSQTKYFQALKVLDGAARDYPFRDVQKDVAVRRGRILRKLSFTGAP